MTTLDLPDLGDNHELVDRVLFLFLGSTPHALYTHTLVGALLQASMWSILAFCVSDLLPITLDHFSPNSYKPG